MNSNEKRLRAVIRNILIEQQVAEAEIDEGIIGDALGKFGSKIKGFFQKKFGQDGVEAKEPKEAAADLQKAVMTVFASFMMQEIDSGKDQAEAMKSAQEKTKAALSSNKLLDSINPENSQAKGSDEIDEADDLDEEKMKLTNCSAAARA